MSKTIKQIADELGVSKTTVRNVIENLGLRSSLRKNGNQFAIDEKQEVLILQAFRDETQSKNANQSQTKTQTAKCEVSDLVCVLQETVDTLKQQIQIKDTQLDNLHSELEKEREHNREKDKQLLDTLNKLAETQSLLAAGTAADKQKALVEKAIEGKQLADETVVDDFENVNAGGIKNFFRNIFKK